MHTQNVTGDLRLKTRVKCISLFAGDDCEDEVGKGRRARKREFHI